MPTADKSHKSPADRAAEQHAPFKHEGMNAFFRDIREDVPVFYSPEIDYWVLTRREDIVAVFQDTERYTARIATEPVVEWPQSVINLLSSRELDITPTQVNSDPPIHGQLKAVNSRFFNIKQFASYEPQIRELVRDHIREIQGRDVVDLVDALTYELPAQVVFLLYGVNDFDPRKIKAWGDLRIKMVFGSPTQKEIEKAATDLADFWDYTNELYKKRLADPKDDYPSMLIRALSDNTAEINELQVKNLLFGMIMAGHETTTNAAGNVILELLRHPDQWQKIVADPTMAKPAVEEGLRFASSVVAWRRRTLKDVEIAGRFIPKGSKILLSLASANRDPAFFDDPETFDISRANAREHLAFGKGIHRCGGAQLAQIELRVMIEELTAAFPNMTLVEDQELRFTPTLAFRGPERLLVRPQG